MKTLCRNYFPSQLNEIERLFNVSAPNSVFDGEELEQEDEAAKESLGNTAVDTGLTLIQLSVRLQKRNVGEQTVPMELSHEEVSSVQSHAAAKHSEAMEELAPVNAQEPDAVFNEAPVGDGSKTPALVPDSQTTTGRMLNDEHATGTPLPGALLANVPLIEAEEMAKNGIHDIQATRTRVSDPDTTEIRINGLSIGARRTDTNDEENLKAMDRIEGLEAQTTSTEVVYGQHNEDKTENLGSAQHTI